MKRYNDRLGDFQQRQMGMPRGPKGTVYFITCEHRVKIGHTLGHVVDRLEELQVGNPFQLKIIRAIHGSIEQERWLHKQFEAHWIRGEWFHFSDAMMEIIPPEL